MRHYEYQSYPKSGLIPIINKPYDKWMSYGVPQHMLSYSSSFNTAHTTVIHHFLTLFLASILAPLSRSLSTTFDWPLRMATRRGVSLSYNKNKYNIYKLYVDEDSENSNGNASNSRLWWWWWLCWCSERIKCNLFLKFRSKYYLLVDNIKKLYNNNNNYESCYESYSVLQHMIKGS